MRRFILLVIGLLGAFGGVRAQRIYGGQIGRQFQSTNVGYTYSVSCTFFADKAGYDALPARLRFGIYRKKDNVFMREFYADKSNDISNGKSIVSCDKSRKTDYVFVRYSQNLILTPQDFPDADGYYMVNDPVGTRNPTDNVASSQIVLYHWFSPQYLWEYFDTSEPAKTSPHWVSDSYNYFCTNEDTNFSLQVVSEPLKSGINNTNYNLVLQNVAPLTGNPNGPLPFRKVDWKAGFSENQMLPGGNFRVPVPPHVINAGSLINLLISAKITKAGTYSVGFILQHSRNGVLLSETYREYEIEVENCLPAPPANIRISQVGRPAVLASARVCDGKAVQLNAGANRPNVSYEWFKNGEAVAGQKDSTLVVKEEGTYTVKLTQRGACLPRTSDPAFITVVPNPKVLIESAVPGGLLCPGGSLRLSTLTSEPFVKYQWSRDSIPVAAATDSAFTVTQVGKYAVTIIDQNGCQGASTPFTVKADSSIKVEMNPIPAQCSNDTTWVHLVGLPAGGKFSGKGVTADRFSPKTAGEGNHLITYLLDDPKACVTGNAAQTASVFLSPSVELGPDQYVSSKVGVQLNKNNPFNNNFSFQWTPPLGLDSPATPSPQATPDQTTTYQLTVSTADGCFTKDTITVVVVRSVHIPDVFTPNGDGINDTWDLRGLDEYPEAEIQVFDRWGHVIYYFSKNNKQPFDGTFNGTSLPTGNYPYSVSTSDAKGHVYRGSLFILR